VRETLRIRLTDSAPGRPTKMPDGRAAENRVAN